MNKALRLVGIVLCSCCIGPPTLEVRQLPVTNLVEVLFHLPSPGCLSNGSHVNHKSRQCCTFKPIASPCWSRTCCNQEESSKSTMCAGKPSSAEGFGCLGHSLQCSHSMVWAHTGASLATCECSEVLIMLSYESTSLLLTLLWIISAAGYKQCLCSNERGSANPDQRCAMAQSGFYCRGCLSRLRSLISPVHTRCAAGELAIAKTTEFFRSASFPCDTGFITVSCWLSAISKDSLLLPISTLAVTFLLCHLRSIAYSVTGLLFTGLFVWLRTASMDNPSFIIPDHPRVSGHK